ncbi:MAG: hypothetical protein Fur0010_14640 [Bdellovibrio sp.]
MKFLTALILSLFLGFHSVSADESTAYGPIGMNPEKLRAVAQNIYNMTQVMTEKFLVADAIGLSFYIMRYMAEIGEYTLVNKDINALIGAFEKITKKEVTQETKDFLAQVASVDFGVRRGLFYARINAFNEKEGAVIPIHKVIEDPNSSLEEIVEVRLKHKGEFYFSELSSTEQLEELKKFVNEKVTVLLPVPGLSKSLNQVHPNLKSSVVSYVAKSSRPANPLNIDIHGLSVLVKTSTILKDIEFEFDRSVFLPGIVTDFDEPVPSLMLSGKAGLLKLKTSVDQ